jgi:SAM-dependent methyltransferase
MTEPTTPVEAPSGAAGNPEYGAGYYRSYCGVPYERSEHWLDFFGQVADGIVRNLQPLSVLDAGCAMGFLVEALHARGVEAWGVDISEFAISQVHESVRDRCSVASLAEPLERRYDLIVSIEVLEHIPPAEIDKVIANLCRSTDRLLLSTTPEDFGEATHLNVQTPDAWSAALAREGFLRDLDQDFSFITPWAALYSRHEEPLAETVRRYDRAWWRLRSEISGVRASLLETQERMEKLEAEGDIEQRPALLKELDQRNEEILRLRDHLIGKDAELGAIRGQVAVLESRARRFLNVATWIQTHVPGGTLLVGLLRRLRRLLG